MADLTARFKVIDEMSAAIERISQSGQQMSDRIEQSGDSISTAFDRMSDRISNVGQEAENAFDGLAESQEQAADALAEYQSQLESGTENTGALEDAAQDAANASEQLAQANQRAADASEELSDAAQQASEDAEDSSNQTQDAVNQLSSVLAAAGIAAAVKEIAGALLEASEAAAEFETGMAKISTIADTSVTSLSSIQDEIMSLSIETGKSVNELSDAVYSAISASVDTADAVDFTATATKLAAGGFTSSSTAVDVLTTALNAYGLEASNATSISDMLITTQNLGKTTVDELAASVGKVIPIASAYGVEMDNLSAAYAELTKGGIATAEAGTYLKSMLNELGDSGSTVSSVLLEQTGHSFAQLTEQGYSLGDVMAVLGDSVNGDAGAFNELWSSSEAGVGALALYNSGAAQFNTTLDAMQSSVGATDAAYETMNNTVADAAEDMSNAAANLQIAIGTQINPLIEKLYGLGTNVLNFMTEFATEHPIVVKAITAIGVAVGVAVLALSGYAAATSIATLATTTIIPAITAFGTALNAALGPIGWVAAGISLLGVAVAAFCGMMEEEADETEGMTAVTREQYYEIQDLNAEYEEACATYGETSEEASRLKYQLDDLNASFEANRQTVEEFTAEVDSLCESVDSISTSFNDSMSSIQSQQTGVMALIQKYDDLSSKTSLTAAEEQALEAVNNQLAASYPELAASMEDNTMSAEEYVEAMKQACEQEAELQREQQAQETYVEALKKQAELEDEIAKAEANRNAEQERLDNMSGWDRMWANTDDLDAYQDALDELTAAQEENNAVIEEIETSWGEAADAAAAAGEETISWQEASSTAYQAVQSDIEELCAAYDEAYQSALDSFSGQFGLFDEASTSSETYLNSTVANAQAAMDSQLAYWESYGANIETLKATSASDLGITQENYDTLMSYVQDGSEEAAGLAASMTAAIEAGDTEAVATLANTISEVSAKQDEIAQSTADWQTDFTDQMNGYQQDMEDIINNMDLSEEAAAAATSTVDSYAAQILAGKADAVSAATEVANAVTRALASANTTVNVGVSSSVAGHASGTTNAEDAFIAGEEGPELIVGKAGSTVFPADETDRIINAVTNDNRVTNYTVASAEQYSADNDQISGTQDKRITLEIAGGSPIEISGSGGASKDEIVDILMSNLRPALLNLVKDEIFEEGDGSYEY